MAAIDWDLVIDFFPEEPSLVDVSIGARDLILQFVNTRLRVSNLDGEDGVTTKLARTYLAAHLGVGSLLKGGADAVAGPVSGESTGDVSRTYVYIQNAISSAIWSSTEFGRAYERLVHTSPSRYPFTV